MSQPRLSAERARELFSYDPVTGVLSWKCPRNSQKIGVVLGKPEDYCRVDLGTERYSIHHVIWLIVTGAFPVGILDHRNGDKSDNRWDNLRECTHSINAQNQRRAHRGSATGLLGVYPYRGRFRSMIAVPGTGRKKYLGDFDTAEKGHEAYVAAKRVLHAGCTI